jgi:hypothetical protein
VFQAFKPPPLRSFRHLETIATSLEGIHQLFRLKFEFEHHHFRTFLTKSRSQNTHSYEVNVIHTYSLLQVLYFVF